MTLRFQKQSSSSNLQSFKCGIEVMDTFIHASEGRTLTGIPHWHKIILRTALQY